MIRLEIQVPDPLYEQMHIGNRLEVLSSLRMLTEFLKKAHLVHKFGPLIYLHLVHDPLAVLQLILYCTEPRDLLNFRIIVLGLSFRKLRIEILTGLGNLIRLRFHHWPGIIARRG